MVCEWLDRAWAFLVSIGEFFGNVWAWVVANAGTIDSVCVFVITVYTFYLTIFPKKLKFLDYAISYSGFWGETIKISLENRSLSSVCVRSVCLKVNDEYLIPIFHGHEDGYRIIDSFHAETFVSKPHTQLYGKDGAKLRIDPATEGKICVIVETSRGKQTITQKVKPAPFNMKKETVAARTDRKTFNGIVISKDMAYGLVYYDLDQTKHNVLIHKSGTMSEAIGEIRRIPDDLMQDEKKLRQVFDKQFRALGCSYTLQPIAPELSVKKPPQRVIVRKKIDTRRRVK